VLSKEARERNDGRAEEIEHVKSEERVRKVFPQQTKNFSKFSNIFPTQELLFSNVQRFAMLS
jgi:hypothetical protein